MEKGIGPILKRFFGSMSEEDRQRMEACYEKMAAMCPCTIMAGGPEGQEKGLMEGMKSFCGGKMGAMTARFNRTNVEPAQSEPSDPT